VIVAVCAFASAILFRYQYSLGILHHQRQLEGEAVLATLRSGSQMKQELALVRQTNALIDANLTSDIDLEETLQYFFKMQDSTKAHLEPHALNVPTDNNPSFKRVPFALKATGTYQQVTAFIYAIETGPRLSNITYFALRRKGDLVILDINLELLGKK
jgi:Tfp pilus assembly protein PilO